MVKPPARIGWWGKLPTRGDFVGRGLPPAWRADWDAWLQRGITLAAASCEAGELRERLGGFAPWRYLALPARGPAWCGIVAPSHDRVGRAFPLTIAGPASDSAHESAARLARLLDAAADGPEALEAAIASLPPPAAGSADEATGVVPPASLWWRLDAPRDTPPRAGGWPPEPQLLLEVLGLQPAAHQIASAE